jgi:3-phenylpropionate/cinnamic acid dioxygenase small subunit
VYRPGVGDRDDIAALVHRYAELIDAGDMDGVVAMFSAATWRSDASGAVLRTPEEIREVYDRIVLYEDGTPKTRHLMNNLIIEMADGADDATARCSYTVLQGGDPGTPIEPILVGRYHDRYHRGPDGWHLADRRFIIDLVGDQSRHFPSDGGPSDGGPSDGGPAGAG